MKARLFALRCNELLGGAMSILIQKPFEPTHNMLEGAKAFISATLFLPIFARIRRFAITEGEAVIREIYPKHVSTILEIWVLRKAERKH
jgi:hypothetical protein